MTRPEGSVRPRTGNGRSTVGEHSADEGSIPSSSTLSACHPGQVESRRSDDASFFEAVLGDGRPLLLVTAGALVFAGGFALFLPRPASSCPMTSTTWG